MIITKTLSNKGQVVIPKAVRNVLGVDFHDDIQFIINDDGVVTVEKPKLTLDDIIGSVQPKKDSTVEDAIELARNKEQERLSTEFKEI